MLSNWWKRWKQGALDRMISPPQQSRVVAAIAAAEKTTSGEIKVHVEPRCKGGDPYKRAVALFEQLGLTHTTERNAVLIYLAVDDRQYALIGDTAIHAAVGDPFWQGASAVLKDALLRGAYGDALVGAVEAVGKELAAKFPRLEGGGAKKNQIGDEISS